MSEEERLTSPAQTIQPASRAGADRTLRTYRVLLSTLGIFAALTIGFYLYVFFANGAQIWQTWVAIGLLSGAIFLVPAVYMLARRGRLNLAGALVLIGVALGYGGNEIAWSGLTIFHTIGGLLLILLAGSLVLPRKYWIWIMTAMIYGSYLVIVNLFLPIPRYSAANLPVLLPYAIVTIALLTLAIALQLLWIIQSRTIRFRLVIFAIFLVLVPLAMVGGISWALNAQTLQQRVQDQLTSVIVLKESEINTWVDSLRVSLLLAVPQPSEVFAMETLLEGTTPENAEFYQVTYSRVEDDLRRIIAQTGAYEEIFLIEPEKGEVVISTDPSQIGTIKDRDFFKLGKISFTVTSPALEPELNRIALFAATPVYNADGLVIGVLAGRANMTRLNAIMQERPGLGETGETYLVSKDHYLLSAARDPNQIVGETYESSEAINQAVDFEMSGDGSYQNYAGIPVVGAYRWLPEMKIALIAEQERSEALSATTRTLVVTLIVIVGAVILAGLASLYATSRITNPLANLARLAERIASGDLRLMAAVEQDDEIGAMAKSFNMMTAQLREMVSGLEKRVAERTNELEQRSLQLQVAAEVARDASAIRDLNELLVRAANLIVDRFNLYHVAIYLNDERQEFTVLKAGTGEAGRIMLEQNFKLQIGAEGIIGFVAHSGTPRVALDVQSDAVYLKLAALPNTQSEVALPLKVGSRIIGVLDVQSSKEAAFDESSVRILQTMADQLAVAIESARLFKETSDTLKELETAYGRYTQESWRRMQERAGQLYGYRYQGLDVEAIIGEARQNPEAADAFNSGQPVITNLEPIGNEEQTGIAVPLKLRGQTVGVVNLRLRGVTPAGLVETYEEIANRLAIAIENARLLQETQFRSEQIRLLQEVTAEAASHIKLEDLLAAVTRKLLDGLNLSRCCAFLFDPDRMTGVLVADCASPDMPALEEPMLGIRLPVAASDVFQDIIHKRAAFAIYNVFRNPKAETLHEFFRLRGTQSVAFMHLTSRGEVIGVIMIEIANPQRIIGDDNLSLIDQISLQIAAAIDVARLFEQTENRAERERMIGHITGRIRETMDIESMVKTAVQELRQALRVPEVVVRLGKPPVAQPPAGDFVSTDTDLSGNGHHRPENGEESGE